MDQFIEDAGTRGEKDSEGHFTLALDRSSWKLARYQLDSSNSYPRHLLVCAVAGGADRFEVEVGKHSTTFRFTGKPLSEADFHALNEAMWRPSADPRIRALAVALSAAGRARRTVTLTCPSPGAGKILRIQAEEVTVMPLDSSTVATGTTVTVEEPLDKAGQNLLAEQGCRAPLQLTINGSRRDKPIGSELPGREVCAVRYIEGSEKFSLAGLAGIKNCQPIIERVPGLPYSALLALVTDQFRSECLMLSNGIKMEGGEDLLKFPYLVATISVSHLTTDLTGEKVRIDAAYQELSDDLQARIDTMLLDFCGKPSLMSSAGREKFSLALRARYASNLPEAVKLYLASNENAPATKDHFRLQELAKSAEGVHGNLLVFRQLRAQALETEQAWATRSWISAEQWVNAQIFLLEQLKRPVDNLMSFRAGLRFLRTGKRTEALKASADKHEEFRNFLLRYPYERGARLPSGMSTSVSEWTETLKVLDDDRFRPGTEVGRLLYLVLHGPQGVDDLHWLTDSYGKSSRFDSRLAFWLDLLLSLQRGSLSWLHQVRLTVKKHFAWSKVSEAAQKEFLAHRTVLKQNPEKELLIQREELEFPLLVYRIALLGRSKSKEARTHLAQFLLLQSFRLARADLNWSTSVPKSFNW